MLLKSVYHSYFLLKFLKSPYRRFADGLLNLSQEVQLLLRIIQLAIVQLVPDDPWWETGIVMGQREQQN